MKQVRTGRVYLIEIYDEQTIEKLKKLKEEEGVNYAFAFRKGLRMFFNEYESNKSSLNNV